MPIVHREGPFRFRIWPNDHTPSHVHAYNSDGLCVIEIESGHVRRVCGMRFPDVVAAAVIVHLNQAKLLVAWRRIHGF
jgi:Domain of unknown function (DUF4160)